MTDADLDAAVRRYYEHPAEVAEFTAAADQGLTPFEAALVRRAFAPGQRVLDIGCGGGREAVPLARDGLRVVAADLVPAMALATVARARAQEVSVGALAASATELPFRDGAFDGATMLGQLIAFIPGRAARLTALRTAWRVLRPGGTLIMTTHNRAPWRFRLYFAWVNRWRRLRRRLGWDSGLDDHDRWSYRIGWAAAQQPLFFHMYDRDEALQDLRDAGFQVVEAKARAELESGRDEPALRASDYLLGFIARRPPDGVPEGSERRHG